jgi:hypothetical protein
MTDGTSLIEHSSRRTATFIITLQYKLWYIQSAKVICVSSISKLECTMFVVRYVLSYYVQVMMYFDSLLYCVYYVSIVCTMYLLFVV